MVALGLGAALAGMCLRPAAARAGLFPAGIANGDFATGDVRGFRADGRRGATVEVVGQDAALLSSPGSAGPRLPGGPASHAVRLETTGSTRGGSVAMLTSLPFVPGAPTLRFAMLSEPPGARLELLFLDPRADVLEPAARDVQQRLQLGGQQAVTGGPGNFTEREVPFPLGPEHPVRIQFRQESLAPDQQAVTLITNLRSRTPAPPPDRDGDTIPDALDNCPSAPNSSQVNSDGDRFGDVCDNCVYVQNNDQTDRDGDGTGNRCAVDIDGDGFTDDTDLDLFAAAFGGAYDSRCDLDDDGRVDLVDLTLLAQTLRVGIGSDELWDFTFAFVDHSINGGLGLAVPQGMVISAIPGSDLIVFPGRVAALVRSDATGNPAAEGVLTSRPFIPRGPRLTLATLSESPHVAATVRVLRPTRTPATPPAGSILLEVPLRNDRPGTGPSARFLTQTVDIARWFNPERPLRSEWIQVQIRQHTTRAGAGYFTLIGDVRTGR